MMNDNGEWLLSFFSFHGITIYLVAELYVIIHGHCMAYNVGLRNIIIESDSMEALNYQGSTTLFLCSAN
jgi:hypothetical protein